MATAEYSGLTEPERITNLMTAGLLVAVAVSAGNEAGAGQAGTATAALEETAATAEAVAVPVAASDNLELMEPMVVMLPATPAPVEERAAVAAVAAEEFPETTAKERTEAQAAWAAPAVAVDPAMPSCSGRSE